MTDLPEPIATAIHGLAAPDHVSAERREPVCAYLYDTNVARARVAALRAALPDNTTVLYAMKANGHPEVVAAFAAAADGLEVASGGELRLARLVGAARIAFGGPAKTDAELAAAVEAADAGADVTINCESVHEVRRLGRLGGADAVRVALRVNRSNPIAGAGGDNPARITGSHTMTGVATPFGIAEADLPAAAAAATAAGLRVDGFHLHAVSNNLDAAAHAAFIRDCVDWSTAAAGALGIDLRQVNVGGGFGIDYTGGTAFDLDTLRVGLPKPAAGVDLVVEPGRFLAAPIGWYAAEVIDVKRNHGRWFAVLRGGTHQFRLPAAWGYSHPFTVVPVDAWPYSFTRPGITDAPVDAVGELCTPRDVLARDQQVAQVRAGDILVFANTGGYAWDISHHDFLQHPYPQMIVL
jgi:diaminopimelate decarboxylase